MPTNTYSGTRKSGIDFLSYYYPILLFYFLYFLSLPTSYIVVPFSLPALDTSDL